MSDNKTNKPAFARRESIVHGKEYAQLLGRLKERFRKSQIIAAVKVNTAMLEYYWEMGRDITRLYESARWGSAFFDCLSLDLKTEFPGQTGFSAANLRYAKRWFEFYTQTATISQQAVEEISDRMCDPQEMPHDFGKVPRSEYFLLRRNSSISSTHTDGNRR